MQRIAMLSKKFLFITGNRMVVLFPRIKLAKIEMIKRRFLEKWYFYKNIL